MGKRSPLQCSETAAIHISETSKRGKNKVNIQMHLCSLIEKYFSNKIQWNQKPQKSLYPATVYKVCQSSADISLRLPFMGFLFVLLM